MKDVSTPCVTWAASDDGVTSVEVDHERRARREGYLSRRAETPNVPTPSARETFLLRGRTLADFINKTKTEKWKALVEILGLDAIESLREDLQRARNELRKASKAAEEEVRTYRRALASGIGGSQPRHGSRQPPADLPDARRRPAAVSLDQVVDPSWLTAAVGASASVSEASDRESLLAEIKALSPPAFEQSALEAWNDLVSSDRARLLPRASLVREAKRLFEAGSIDQGRCPLCGQKVDHKSLAPQNRERARGSDGGVSRLSSASAIRSLSRRMISTRRTRKRLSIHERARASWISSCRRPPGFRSPRSQTASRHSRPSRSRRSTSWLSELRKWDRAAGALAEKASPAEPSTRDTQLVMLAALCQAGQCLAAGREKGGSRQPRAGSRRTCLRRLSEEAEGRPVPSS